MRLYAHTLAKVWRQWDDVVAWRLDGPHLHIVFEGRSAGSSAVEMVELPREVIGLRDDGQVRHVSDSRNTGYRPDPAKVERQERREGTLRIPDREPPRSRFGDSPRRRQFKGDGS